MAITSSLRFLYIFWGSGLLCGAATDTGAPEDTGADIGRSAVGTPYLSFGDLRGRE